MSTIVENLRAQLVGEVRAGYEAAACSRTEISSQDESGLLAGLNSKVISLRVAHKVVARQVVHELDSRDQRILDADVLRAIRLKVA